MKRVLAVLVLTVAGLLVSSVYPAPEAALAVEPEQQGIEIPDTRDGIVADVFGDPNGWGDGLGDQQSNDDLADLDSLECVPDGVSTWEDLVAYLIVVYWTL